MLPALAARGHSITLFSSDRQPPIEHRRVPDGIELLHWSLFETVPEVAEAYDLIVYNVGDHSEYHFGVLKLIDRFTGVCIFHDFYLVDLFLGWCATEIEKPLADLIVASIYGEETAKEFWAREGQPDFQEWAAAHVPLTEWVARKALAAVAHAPFYKKRLADSSAGPVTVIPLAWNAPANFVPIRDQNGPVRILTLGVLNTNKRVEAVPRFFWSLNPPPSRTPLKCLLSRSNKGKNLITYQNPVSEDYAQKSGKSRTIANKFGMYWYVASR